MSREGRSSAKNIYNYTHQWLLPYCNTVDHYCIPHCNKGIPWPHGQDRPLLHYGIAMHYVPPEARQLATYQRPSGPPMPPGHPFWAVMPSYVEFGSTCCSSASGPPPARSQSETRASVSRLVVPGRPSWEEIPVDVVRVSVTSATHLGGNSAVSVGFGGSIPGCKCAAHFLRLNPRAHVRATLPSPLEAAMAAVNANYRLQKPRSSLNGRNVRDQLLWYL
ncbi:hypothetical protein FB45DRAFT_875739 [Roridomyces roridus]|uniref:Uncharacterized protein n=1 Tax=Roridomyces roridus TaxID=1738132 RepID=A0AAD7B4G6_9AGAR|nr:hypothetical protein FB45DRAFT_875739 [Roridomyces roridus]